MDNRAVRRKYDDLAHVYDRIEAPLEWLLMGRPRKALLAHAKGQVLEVAVGTGKNLRHYALNCSVVGLDLSLGMLKQARKRNDRPAQAHHGARYTGLVNGDAMALPFPDETFDTVAVTLSLCTVPEPEVALREMARVLRADGSILLLEHVRSTAPLLASLQDKVTPWQVRRIGCHLNRDTVATVRRAGFTILEERRYFWRSLVSLRLSRP